jgi:hypothetical protein
VFESGTQVSSSSCSASGESGSSGSVTSCKFVLSDGRQFICPEAFALSHPTVDDIVRAKVCSSLASSAVAPTALPLRTAIANARGCLTGQALSAHGGPASPAGPSAASSPDGELIVRSGNGGAFVAFYANARKAERLEPGVLQNARRFGGQVQRRGAVTVIWVRPPATELRAVVDRCVFR